MTTSFVTEARRPVSVRRAMRHYTPYRDLERRADRPPSLVIEDARQWASAGARRWRPEQPDRNGAETLAVIGALWYASLAGLATTWDGEALRGDDPLATIRLHAGAWRAGKGGIWITGPAPVQIAPGRANLDFWSGQIDLARIWRTCHAALAPDWEHSAIDCSATGYDPSAVLTSAEVGFSPTRLGLKIPLRPAVEIMSILGVEGLIRIEAIEMRRSDHGRVLLLPEIAGIPLRDWSDMRQHCRQPRRLAYAVEMLGTYRRRLGRPVAWMDAS
jgi:hypothetical protein